MSIHPKECDIEEQVRLLLELDKSKDFILKEGRRWDLKEGLEALNIDPSVFADEFVLSVIHFFLFFRSAPHQAFSSYESSPSLWVDMVPTLDGALGSKL